jgi:hypothetical protein
MNFHPEPPSAPCSLASSASLGCSSSRSSSSGLARIGGSFFACRHGAARESLGHHRSSAGRQNQGRPTYHGFARTDDAARCVSVGKSMMSPPPKHALTGFHIPSFPPAKSALCRCEKLPERMLEKLSLCDDITIVMFALVFLICSEKSKDQCVCLRLSEVRLIHHLNIEKPPFTS